MRAPLGPFALLACLACAAPAPAQIVGRPDTSYVPTPNPFIDDGRLPGPGIGAEVNHIVRTINRARERGQLTRREARRLRREARRIGAQGAMMGRDGLSASESAALTARAEALRSIVTRPAPAPTGRSGS